MICIEKVKVSIVVPIYNVEKYMYRCIDSILHQTYSNLEVILVNDGSPDQCGAIANTYKEKDVRVKVIHKSNGGLSDARNYGMKSVTGKYTMFVDSDDWLEPTMVEAMVHYSNQFAADVVQSAFYYAYDDKLLIDERHYQSDDAPVCLDNQALMYELVKNEKVKNFAWGKLYKTELIKDIPFKKGVLFEDVFWAHQVMSKVSKYLILHQPYYYYYQRDDSIVATYTPKNLDIIKGLKERHRFIEEYYSDLTNESYQLILKTCFIHYHLLFVNRRQDKMGIHRKNMELYIQENYKALKQAVKHNKTLKRQLFLFNLHPYLHMVYQGFIKSLRKVKILSQPAGLKQVNV